VVLKILINKRFTDSHRHTVINQYKTKNLIPGPSRPWQSSNQETNWAYLMGPAQDSQK